MAKKPGRRTAGVANLARHKQTARKARRVQPVSRIILAVVAGGAVGYLLHAWAGPRPLDPPVEAARSGLVGALRLAPVSLQTDQEPFDEEGVLRVERRRGRFFLGNEALTPTTWTPRLAEELARTKSHILALAVGDDERFGAFVELIDQAQRLPVERIVVLVTPHSGSSAAPAGNPP